VLSSRSCHHIGHMVLVTEDPGGVDGAIGVITLEDVIEELIGEVFTLLSVVLFRL
jgi:Mg2+/Co2+ transporter CorC